MEHIELQGVSIVLIGTFSPAIFNPDWLVARGVISADEGAQSSVDLIHPEYAQFSVGDLMFEITEERFTLHSVAEPFIRSADIIAGIFIENLPHTPINSLGINYLVHFRVKDRRQQHALGRQLAPLAPWGEWGEKLESVDDTKTGGMISLTMQEQGLTDRKAGNVRVTVQPSNRIEPLGTGVFVQVNDHYEGLGAEGEDSAAEVCTKTITPSLEKSRRIVTSLSDYARKL